MNLTFSFYILNLTRLFTNSQRKRKLASESIKCRVIHEEIKFLCFLLSMKRTNRDKVLRHHAEESLMEILYPEASSMDIALDALEEELQEWKKQPKGATTTATTTSPLIRDRVKRMELVSIKMIFQKLGKY